MTAPSTSELVKLRLLADARATHRRQALFELMQKASALRSDIARLDGFRQGANAPDPSLIPMRQIGADLLWKSWIARQRELAQIELARTRARMEAARRAAHKDIGKAEALAALGREQRDADRKSRNTAEMEARLDMATARAGINRPGRQ